MDTPEVQLWWALGYCTFMLILAFILYKFPPKKINYIYGYRSKRSMKNDETWKAANTYAGLLMLRLCIYCFFVPAFCYVFLPEYNLLITIIVNTLLVISILYYTEKYLKKHFDENGNRKADDTGSNA